MRPPDVLPFLYLEITGRCNASCGMCSFPTHYPRRGAELSEAELCALVDEAAALGTIVFSVGGGEPFLRPETPGILERAAKRGITPAVDTNGSLLEPELCRRLAKIQGLTIAMSLDSHEAEVHDGIRGLPCFERLTEAARFFVRDGPHVTVLFTTTITARNADHLEGVARLARDIGVAGIRCTPVHGNLQHRHGDRRDPAEWHLPEARIPLVEEQLRRMTAIAKSGGLTTNSEPFLQAIPRFLRGMRVPHACQAGFAFCSVDPYGTMMPCYDCAGGPSIREAGLLAAWRSPPMNRLRRDVLRCARHCWNLGNAEPSLRYDPMFIARNPLQVMRELRTFL